MILFRYFIVLLAGLCSVVIADNDFLFSLVARNKVRTLFVNNDTLFIGTNKGAAILQNDCTTVQLLPQESGLPECDIVDFACDGSARYWVATGEGLYRQINGLQFEPFELAEGRIPTALSIDLEGNLLAGTKDNYIYRVKPDTITIETLFDPFIEDHITTFCMGTDSVLWAGSKMGLLFCYGDMQWDTVMYSESLLDHSINCLLSDSKGRLWLAMDREGAYYMENGGWNNSTIENGLPSKRILSIMETNNDTLWFATDSGLCVTTDAATFTPVSPLKPLPKLITCLAYGSQLFIGTGEYDLFVQKENEFERKKIVVCQLDEDITDIYTDKNGTLNVGCYNGLSTFSAGRWQDYTRYEGYVGLNIQNITRDREGVLWAGSLYEGITAVDSSGWHTYTAENSGLASNDICALAVDCTNVVCMGTFAGMSLYKNGSWETITEKDGLTCNCTFALCVDSNNGYWIGTADGLNYYNGDSIVTYTADDVLCEGFVHALGIDKNGILWVGTSGGLMSYDGMQWKTYREPQGLVNNYINEITPHKDSSIWIGTMKGVSIYKDGVFSNIEPGNELVSSRIYAIAFDNEDRAWIGGYGGISVYSIQGNDIILEYKKNFHQNRAEIIHHRGSLYATINCAAPQNILVQIYSMHGRMLWSNQAGLFAEGAHSIPLNSKSFGTGRYILKISGEKMGSQHLLFNIME